MPGLYCCCKCFPCATVTFLGDWLLTHTSSTNPVPSFGPVIAGVLAQKLGWRWIFWLLVILTGSYFIVLVLFMPETQRKIVGNGSIPTKALHRSLFDELVKDRKKPVDLGADDVPAGQRKKFRFPNPLRCIPILFSKANFAIILVGSITYTVKMVL